MKLDLAQLEFRSVALRPPLARGLPLSGDQRERSRLVVKDLTVPQIYLIWGGVVKHPGEVHPVTETACSGISERLSGIPELA